MSEKTILSVKDIVKTYPGVVAIDHVSFDVREGEVHALIGENGAGKSTLIKTLSGAITPDSGTITIDGKSFSSLTPATAKEQGISVIYQEFTLIPGISAAENVFLGEKTTPGMESGKIFVEGKQVRIRSCSDAIKNGIGYIPEDRKNQGVFLRNTIKWNTVINNIQGYSKGIFVDEKQEDAVAQDYKERFSIRTPSLEQKVGNLSGGNQQKVVIAKTLAANSNIIIFDEPTRGIDVSAKQEIYKLMNELVEAGKAIIMVSSDMPELLGMSDRIVVIAEGHKNGEVEKADFDQNYILDLASGGKVKGAV